MMESKWSKAFIINWVFMIFVYEFVVLKKVKPITHGNPELHKKYPGFKRNDAHLFTNRLVNWSFCWMFPFRFLLVCLGMFMLGVCGWLTQQLKPEGQVSGDLKGILGVIIRFMRAFWSRLCLFAVANTVWIRNHTPKICYKKYLGPNWQPDTKPCSTIVTNHQAFHDSFLIAT